MKITRVEPFILHVPVTRNGIADSTHVVTHWGMPGVRLHTDDGRVGYGYTGTHAHLPTDRLITDCIARTYGPLLLGEDPRRVQHLWDKLARFPPALWVGRSGITQMALSAVDVALWDLKAKAAGQPLWRLLGGGEAARLEAYNTDGGWLNWSTQQLVDDARRMVEEEGFRGVKIKVGQPDPRDDLKRVEAVRRALGDDARLMVDANGKWDLPTALHVGRRFRDFDVYWFEEPLWHDDVAGHAALARALDTPLALGELLYTLDAFRHFIDAGAVHFVQVDVVRVGGVTAWWEVADLAHGHRLPVVPHHGDMMQAQRHLGLAHRACRLLEYIPWTLHCFEEPATVEDGYYALPQQPGAGTTLRPEALDQYDVL